VLALYRAEHLLFAATLLLTLIMLSSWSVAVDEKGHRGSSFYFAHTWHTTLTKYSLLPLLLLLPAALFLTPAGGTRLNPASLPLSAMLLLLLPASAAPRCEPAVGTVMLKRLLDMLLTTLARPSNTGCNSGWSSSGRRCRLDRRGCST
jgi:hypothetical protein